MEYTPQIFRADKLFFHGDRVREFLETGRTYPITYEIDLTNRCDHACPDCAGGRMQSKATLNTDEVTDYIQQISSLGGRGIIFTGGGEPTLHKDCGKIIEYANRMTLDVGLITHGGRLSLLSHRDLVRIVQGTTWTRISLDGSTGEEFQKTHGRNQKEFDNVKDGIRRLAKIKLLYNSEMTLGVGYLTDDRMIDGMVDATKVVKELEADYIQFRPFHHSEHNPKLEETIERCLEEQTKDFKVLWSAHKYNNLGNKKQQRPYKKCLGGDFATVIDADANVIHCCHGRGYEWAKMGNLRDKSLKSILDDEDRQRKISDIDLKTCGPFLCRDDPFNRILWNMREDRPEHDSFL